jgi:hypothetical protein
MTDEKLAKMDACKALLPEPGPEVVGELIGELKQLRQAARAVGHKNSCPAIERLQPDRRTMAASGPCDCWHGPLQKLL